MFSVWLKLSGLHSLLKLKKWNYLQKEGSTYFKGNIIITFGSDDKWDAYLMDVFKYVKHNDGVAFILVVIDKFLWMRLWTDKNRWNVTSAFINEFLKVDIPIKFAQEIRSQMFNTFFIVSVIEAMSFKFQGFKRVVHKQESLHRGDIFFHLSFKMILILVKGVQRINTGIII